MKTYHIYIMASASRVLYVGVTGDLLRRVAEHKQEKVPGFTARYRVTELVYFEAFGDMSSSIGPRVGSLTPHRMMTKRNWPTL